MTSFHDCPVCGGSGRHSFERCFECKGVGMIEDGDDPDDKPDDEAEPDEEWHNMYQPWFL
jgi:hypothetical protein